MSYCTMNWDNAKYVCEKCDDRCVYRPDVCSSCLLPLFNEQKIMKSKIEELEAKVQSLENVKEITLNDGYDLSFMD